MTALISEWPAVEPGRPYRWLLSMSENRPAPTCLQHRERTDGLGICISCVSAWRASLGADPFEWTECRICQYPLHPAAASGGFDTCPTCEPRDNEEDGVDIVAGAQEAKEKN